MVAITGTPSAVAASKARPSTVTIRCGATGTSTGPRASATVRVAGATGAGSGPVGQAAVSGPPPLVKKSAVTNRPDRAMSLPCQNGFCSSSARSSAVLTTTTIAATVPA